MNSDVHSVESPLFSLEKQELRIEKTTPTLHHRFFGLERNGQILQQMGNICLAFSFMWLFFPGPHVDTPYIRRGNAGSGGFDQTLLQLPKDLPQGKKNMFG